MAMERTCKGCGRTASWERTGWKDDYCTVSCMKSKARELKRGYWELVRLIRTYEPND